MQIPSLAIHPSWANSPFTPLWGRVGNHADTHSIIFWVIVLVLVSAALGIVLVVIRKRTIGGKADQSAQGGLMDELRRLHKSGQISHEEFERARASWRSRAVEAMDKGRTAPVRSTARSPARAPDRPAPSRRAPSRSGTGGALVAKPGFDLTGAPLPQPQPAAETRADSPPGLPSDPAPAPPPDPGVQDPPVPPPGSQEPDGLRP